VVATATTAAWAAWAAWTSRFEPPETLRNPRFGGGFVAKGAQFSCCGRDAPRVRGSQRVHPPAETSGYARSPSAGVSGLWRSSATYRSSAPQAGEAHSSPLVSAALNTSEGRSNLSCSDGASLSGHSRGHGPTQTAAWTLADRSDDLIAMPDVNATEASRNFSRLLDEVEHDGATYRIVRHGTPVAELSPVSRCTGKQLKALLDEHRPDPAWRTLFSLQQSNALGDHEARTISSSPRPLRPLTSPLSHHIPATSKVWPA
jgi:prevent-host-death family protein